MPGSIRKRGDSWELEGLTPEPIPKPANASGEAPRRRALAALPSERSSSSQPASTIHAG